MRLKNGLRKKTIKAIKTILLIMNDKEKLEAIQQVIDEISSKQHNYLGHESLLEYFERQIKKILES